jgi:hypothetical protein
VPRRSGKVSENWEAYGSNMDSPKGPMSADPGPRTDAAPSLAFGPYVPYTPPTSKYPVLSTVTTLMLWVGWCAAALGTIGVLFGFGDLFQAAQATNYGGALDVMSGSAKIAGGVVLLIGGLALVYLAESSRVMVDIEDNTARLLERFPPPTAKPTP